MKQLSCQAVTAFAAIQLHQGAPPVRLVVDGVQ
jgi:hypothetical protein